MSVVVLGKLLGTCTGWDEVDTNCYNFYNFVSCVQALPNFDLIYVDYFSGIFIGYVFDDPNKEPIEFKFDLATIIAGMV